MGLPSLAACARTLLGMCASDMVGTPKYLIWFLYHGYLDTPKERHPRKEKRLRDVVSGGIVCVLLSHLQMDKIVSSDNMLAYLSSRGEQATT